MSLQMYGGKYKNDYRALGVTPSGLVPETKFQGIKPIQRHMKTIKLGLWLKSYLKLPYKLFLGRGSASSGFFEDKIG